MGVSMKLSQLEYILAVEETGSINLGAEKLFVSQSQISLAIKDLEDEIGEKIFIRTNKGVSATPFGKNFLSYAKSVMEQIGEMQNLSKRLSNDTRSLSICTHGGRFMSDIIAMFYEKHRNEKIFLNMWDSTGPETIDMVSQHLADIGILRIWNFQKSTITKQLERKKLTFYPITISPATVVVGEKNPLYHHPGNTISIEELKDYVPISPGYWKSAPGFDIYSQFPEITREPPIFASSRAATFEILSKTQNTYVLAATPQGVYAHLDYYPNTKVFTLEGNKYFAYLGWIKHKTSALSSFAQEFVDLLTEQLNA